MGDMMTPGADTEGEEAKYVDPPPPPETTGEEAVPAEETVAEEKTSTVPKKDTGLKRASYPEYVQEVLGLEVAPTADPDYATELAKLDEYLNKVNAYKATLLSHVANLKAYAESGATLRVAATTSFGETVASKLTTWSEAWASVESAALDEADAKSVAAASLVDSYVEAVKDAKADAKAETLKARRDLEHYEGKVASLTAAIGRGEKDALRRAERDRAAREKAIAKHKPPPDHTHYFFEDSNEVAASKLDKLKAALEIAASKLEVAKAWNARAVEYGKKTFGAIVDGAEYDIDAFVAAAIEIDATFAKAMASTMSAADSTLPLFIVEDDSTTEKDAAPLAERVEAAKHDAGYGLENDDVPKQSTLDDDDDEDLLPPAFYFACHAPSF